MDELGGHDLLIVSTDSGCGVAWRVGMLLFCGAISAAMLLLVILMPEHNSHVTLPEFLLGIALPIGFALVMNRFSWMGTYSLDDRGIEHRRGGRPRRLGWADVEGVLWHRRQILLVKKKTRIHLFLPFVAPSDADDVRAYVETKLSGRFVLTSPTTWANRPSGEVRRRAVRLAAIGGVCLTVWLGVWAAIAWGRFPSGAVRAVTALVWNFLGWIVFAPLVIEFGNQSRAAMPSYPWCQSRGTEKPTPILDELA